MKKYAVIAVVFMVAMMVSASVSAQITICGSAEQDCSSFPPGDEDGTPGVGSCWACHAATSGAAAYECARSYHSANAYEHPGGSACRIDYTSGGNSYCFLENAGSCQWWGVRYLPPSGPLANVITKDESPMDSAAYDALSRQIAATMKRAFHASNEEMLDIITRAGAQRTATAAYDVWRRAASSYVCRVGAAHATRCQGGVMPWGSYVSVGSDGDRGELLASMQ